MQTARSQTEADASLAKGKDGQGPPPPEMRILPLGEDRDGRLFWNLQCASALTGDIHFINAYIVLQHCYSH